jgi:hypothetical protein
LGKRTPRYAVERRTEVREGERERERKKKKKIKRERKREKSLKGFKG